MGDEDKPISPEEYRTIARNVPIVSVDLLVHHDGGLVLGKRQNEPAKDEWFVPGGTVLKGETLIDAVHRVAQEELGSDVVVDGRLGTYEHFYDAAATEGVESKQYLATAFILTPRKATLEPDEQHDSLQVFDAPFPELHNYVERYIHDLRVEGYRH
jgi:colanic acid biosynthesis protein WcaH